MYGSVTEDIVTGYLLHVRGWRSVYCMPARPAFKVCPLSMALACLAVDPQSFQPSLSPSRMSANQLTACRPLLASLQGDDLRRSNTSVCGAGHALLSTRLSRPCMALHLLRSPHSHASPKSDTLLILSLSRPFSFPSPFFVLVPFTLNPHSTAGLRSHQPY